MHGGVLDFRQNFWFDLVDQAVPDGDGRVFDDEKNGDGYGDTDQRINDRKSKPRRDHAHQHRQAGEAIHTGVLSIRDEGGRPDFLTHFDPKNGDSLISDKSDDRGCCDPPKMLHGFGMNNLYRGLIRGDAGGEKMISTMSTPATSSILP
jgi:hypothetical protein